MLVAAEDDERSAKAVHELAAMGEGVDAKVHASGGHGNAMVVANEGELDWLSKLLVDALQ